MAGPAPPPLPPNLGPGYSSSKPAKSVMMGRDALLSDIVKGSRLRKVEINDRSLPAIDKSVNMSYSKTAGSLTGIHSGSGSFQNTQNMPHGPQLGDILAGGIPKLKSTSQTSRLTPGDVKVPIPAVPAPPLPVESARPVPPLPASNAPPLPLLSERPPLLSERPPPLGPLKEAQRSRTVSGADGLPFLAEIQNKRDDRFVVSDDSNYNKNQQIESSSGFIQPNGAVNSSLDPRYNNSIKDEHVENMEITSEGFQKIRISSLPQAEAPAVPSLPVPAVPKTPASQRTVLPHAPAYMTRPIPAPAAPSTPAPPQVPLLPQSNTNPLSSSKKLVSSHFQPDNTSLPGNNEVNPSSIIQQKRGNSPNEIRKRSNTVKKPPPPPPPLVDSPQSVVPADIKPISCKHRIFSNADSTPSSQNSQSSTGIMNTNSEKFTIKATHDISKTTDSIHSLVDTRFKFLNAHDLPKPRKFKGCIKLYPSSRGSSVPLDLALFS